MEGGSIEHSRHQRAGGQVPSTAHASATAAAEVTATTAAAPTEISPSAVPAEGSLGTTMATTQAQVSSAGGEEGTASPAPAAAVPPASTATATAAASSSGTGTATGTISTTADTISASSVQAGLADLAASAARWTEEYDVALPITSEGLMIDIEKSRAGSVVFQRYRRSKKDGPLGPAGSVGPAERDELFHRGGDIIVAIDGISTAGKSFADVVAMLRERVESNKDENIPALNLRMRCGAIAAAAAAAPRGPKKRKGGGGRPKGSKDKKKRRVSPSRAKAREVPWKSRADRETFAKARAMIADKERSLQEAQAAIVRQEESIRRAQAKLESLKKKVTIAQDAIEKMSERKADDLLLEPTEWNEKYRRLLALRDRTGVDISHLSSEESKREGLYDNDDDAREHRILSRFLSQQRTAKKNDALDAYKEILLKRINFVWDPPQGPTAEKWNKHYRHFAEFVRIHGHVNVPPGYGPDPRLRDWVKTQRYGYHATRDGKTVSGITEERIQLLEEAGMDWGVKRVFVPWEQRFNELLAFRKDHGHVNIPWQWAGNRPLANWVNGQRKKYAEIKKGKKTNLTPEQIRRLEEVGFRWTADGKARYGSEPGDGGAAMAAMAAAASEVAAAAPRTLEDTMAEADALLKEGSYYKV